MERLPFVGGLPERVFRGQIYGRVKLEVAYSGI